MDLFSIESVQTNERVEPETLPVAGRVFDEMVLVPILQFLDQNVEIVDFVPLERISAGFCTQPTHVSTANMGYTSAPTPLTGPVALEPLVADSVSLAPGVNEALRLTISHQEDFVVTVDVPIPTPVNEHMASSPAGTRAAPAPVIECVSSSLAAAYAAPAPATDNVTPTPTGFYAAPARVINCMAPAPVIEQIAPSPPVTCFAPRQALPSDYSMAAVTAAAISMNRSLPNKSVYTSTPVNKLCMHRSFKSRNSL